MLKDKINLSFKLSCPSLIYEPRQKQNKQLVICTRRIFRTALPYWSVISDFKMCDNDKAGSTGVPALRNIMEELSYSEDADNLMERSVISTDIVHG